MENSNLIAIFLTGLFAGALTCLAVQGGLLATSIAQHEEKRLKDGIKKTGNALPILSFVIAKLIAYTFLGFLLGWFGSIFQLSLNANIILQIIVGVFMLGTALNLLNVHPIFRYFIIQPPRFLTRYIRKESKSGSYFTPALLGAFTVFIPCGATQAVMALSVASGNPFSGAAILFAFVLGTSPLFFTLGYLATKLSSSLQQKFMKFAAFTIILLAAFNLNNTLALTGNNFTIENIGKGFWCTISYCESSESATTQNSKQAITEADLNIEATGYNPNSLTVKAGSKITLHLKNNGGGGCTQAFTIPSLGIQKIVPLGATDTLTFTAPDKTGDLAFMCSMGMYRGNINVI
ncbi:MAG TPA: sulfite exporter TauE/SafE family protein [Candidatus Limnocylindrales bacterium]|nr:sulfite exporter TauE/SafE family protein [Candidatus Limnocylindrales bacterium]